MTPTPLAEAALSAVSGLGLPVPATGPVTRAAAVAAVDAVAGLAPDTTAAATYQDVASTSSAFGAIEAAVQAGLMAGWAPTSGDFQPDAPMSRIDLAVLATNALGLRARAMALAGDTGAFSGLTDLAFAGANRGYAVLMLEMGIVPPVSATRFMPNAAVTPGELAVSLERLWLDADVPAAATLTPASPRVLTGATDALSLAVTNRLGRPVPARNLMRYPATFRVSGGSVANGAFLAPAPGTYQVTARCRAPS